MRRKGKNSDSLNTRDPAMLRLYSLERVCAYLLSSNSLQPHELYSPWSSPGQNTGVGSLSLLQGIFPTKGSNLGLPHCW